ncbi:MAG: DUF1698 domain-containing protein [Candidatus Adiutrix sp.]|jgi:tRNA (mo5U34)-methyltransferase|nr:DUF1698 domain-containing protein [Candidatus Adiutrix sp.]
MDKTKLETKVKSLAPWYHRIDFGNGLITEGKKFSYGDGLIRDQSLTFELYEPHLPKDFHGLRVLDLGANACGLSIEFAKRGADVVAVEPVEEAAVQAELVIAHFGLADKIVLHRLDLFDVLPLGKFDIICYLGLAYHIRHPQLALDMLSNICTKYLLASTQTIPGEEMTMLNRIVHPKHKARFKQGRLVGWEPTEALFQRMVHSAGFVDCTLLSTSPHSIETKDRILGNRSYFIAKAGACPHPLPFMSQTEAKKATLTFRQRCARFFSTRG